VIRPLRLLHLGRLFPGKKRLTMEGLLQVGLEPAEAFTGDFLLVATDPGRRGRRLAVKCAPRFAERSLYRAEISA